MLQVEINGKIYEIPYSDGTYQCDDITVTVNGAMVTIDGEDFEVFTDEDYSNDKKYQVNF